MAKFVVALLVLVAVYSPVILWFNLKQIAIVSLVAFLVSTLCLCYQKKVHQNPLGGTLAFSLVAK